MPQQDSSSRHAPKTLGCNCPAGAQSHWRHHNKDEKAFRFAKTTMSATLQLAHQHLCDGRYQLSHGGLTVGQPDQLRDRYLWRVCSYPHGARHGNRDTRVHGVTMTIILAIKNNSTNDSNSSSASISFLRCGNLP